MFSNPSRSPDLAVRDLAVRGLADFAATTVEFVAHSAAGRAWLSARAGFAYPDAIAAVMVRKSLSGEWLDAANAAGLAVGR